LLGSFTADEVALLIEVVLDRGVNGAEFLQRLHPPKPEHRTLSSSERLMRVFCAIVHPAPASLPVRIANSFQRCAIGAINAGQAIVGNVEGGGIRTKSENQPHALGYAPAETLRSANAKREALPIASDGER
jgi:hypothetical protein